MRRRVALALAGICILAAGCSSSSNHATPTSATTSTTPPPVAEAALDGLLLTPAEITTAMGATQLSVTADSKDMEDSSAQVSRPECLSIYSPGQAKPYAASGSTAFHKQDLSDQKHTQIASQSVVLLPSAQQAAAFFTASSQSWQACSNGGFIDSLTGGREWWDVGPISNTNGVLSTVTRTHLEVYDNPAPQVGRPDWTGQRVLTVSNNVVIDVNASCAGGPCSANPNATPAVSIAQRIASKVPK